MILRLLSGLIALVLMCQPQFGQAQQDNQANPGQPQDQKTAQEGHYWKDIPLEQVLIKVREETKKNFLFTDNSFKTKTITFMSSKTLQTPDDWFAIFESILQMNGYALVKTGEPPNDFYKILPTGVPVPNASQSPTEVIVGDEKVRPEDKMIIRLFIVKHVNPQDLFVAFQSFLPSPVPGKVQVIQSARAVMVRDYDYNIAMLEKLVTMIDAPDVLFEVHRLEQASARDAATTLETLINVMIAPRPGAGGGGTEKVKIVPDLRTNSLFIMAEPHRMPKIIELVKEIDAKVGLETSGIFIYALKHTNADDVAKTLNNLYSRSSTGSTQPSLPGGAGQPAIVATPTGQNIPVIVSDAPTNSLIIVSERTTYQTLEHVIKQLDRRKPQVLIRATVVEVDSRDSFNMAIELANAALPADNPRTFGLTSFGLSTLIDSDGDSIPDKRVPTVTTGMTFGVFKDKQGNIPGLLHALQTKGKISILSEPEAVTNDNTKATLTVKDQRPYTKINTVAQAGQTTTDFDFKDASTILNITPHISEGSSLRLDVEVTVQQFGPPIQAQGTSIPPPPLTSRELKTTITIADTRTVVIGGLSAQDKSDSDSGVPILMDIPILGSLFKSTTKEKNSTTLYVFITPTILSDEEFGDVAKATQEHKELLEKLRGEPLRLYTDYQGGPVPSTSFQYRMPIVDRKKDK